MQLISGFSESEAFVSFLLFYIMASALYCAARSSAGHTGEFLFTNHKNVLCLAVACLCVVCASFLLPFSLSLALSLKSPVYLLLYV